VDKELSEYHEREPYYEDEIDLYQLIQVLLKRKKIIIGIFLVAVITAIAASYLMKPVYRVSAVIGPGQILVDNDGVSSESDVDTPNNIAALVSQNPFHYKILTNLGFDATDATSSFKVKASIQGGTKYISLNIDSADPEKAKQYLSALISEINSFYLPKVEANVMLLNNEKKRILSERRSINYQIEMVKNKLSVLGQQYDRLQKQLGIAEPNVGSSKLTSVDKLILTLMLENNDIQRQEFRQELEALKAKLESLDLEEVDLKSKLAILGVKLNPDEQDGKSDDIKVSGIKVIQEPVIDPQRVSPKRTLMVAVAGVLGLFVGVFAAFAVEFWQSHKVSA